MKISFFFMLITKITINVEGPEKYVKLKAYIEKKGVEIAQNILKKLNWNKDIKINVKISEGKSGRWEGLYIPDRNIIFIKAYPYRSGYTDLKELLTHEISHLIVHHITKGAIIPMWLYEGIAVKMEGKSEWNYSTVLLRAVTSNSLIPLSYLNDYFPPEREEIAYAESVSIVELLMKKGDITAFLEEIGRTGDWKLALKRTFKLSFYQFEKQWLKSLKKRYTIVLIIFSSTTFWFMVAILFLISYTVKKRRTAKKLEEMDWYE